MQNSSMKMWTLVLAALAVSSFVSELPVGLARKSLCCAGVVIGQYCKKECWDYFSPEMLGLHNAESDVSQHFIAGQLCIALGLDQQSSVVKQLQQTVQRSLRVALISTQVPTKLNGLDHRFPSALTESRSGRPDTLVSIPPKGSQL